MIAGFRDHLFSALEKQSHPSKTTAQILIDELGVSRGTAYKKISGEVKLTLDEALTLANKFGISLDAAMPRRGDQVLFRYPSLNGEEMSPGRFVDQLIGTIDMLTASPGLKIRYTTCEIPLFNYLYYPELTALKLYFYSNSVWNLLGNERPGMEWIDALLTSSDFKAKCLRFFDTLAATPTEEYYQLNILDTTLRQVQFLRETEQIDASFAALVFRQLADMTTMLSSWAENGRKQLSNGEPGASYELHFNELVFTNIFFMTENDAGRILFNNFDSPNFTVCLDERVLDRIETWFDRIKGKSNPISKQNERQRQVFFHEIQRRIIEAERK